MDKKIDKKKWPPKKIALIGISGVSVFFVTYIFIFGDQSSKLNVERERLTISSVKKGPFQEFIPITGTVEPIQTFYLDLSEGGKVIQKFVEEGAMLNAGEPIIRLDNPNLSLQVMSTQSSFLQAESVSRQTRLSFEQNLLNRQDQLLNLNLNLLEQERIYNNNKRLFEKNLIAKNEFETSKEKYETLIKSRELLVQRLNNDSLTFKQLIHQDESDIEMKKQYLMLVENQLANLTVRAPISGQLSSLKADIGQSVSTGYRIGQIDVIDSYKIRASIDEHYIARVSAGQTGEFNFAGGTYQLEIKTVYPQVNEGRFEVDMHFVSAQPQGIRRGQTVHIKLELGELTEALLVERGGFYQTTGGQWVYALNEDGNSAIKRNIKLGRQNTQVFEVLEGLKPGEKVITSSYDNFGNVDKLVIND